MSTIRIDDTSIPVAVTPVGLTILGSQGGQTVRVPTSLLKGNKGDEGEDLKFEDLTPVQIAVLQQPALDLVDKVEQAITNAEAATQNAQFQADRFTDIEVLTSEAISDETDYNDVDI